METIDINIALQSHLNDLLFSEGEPDFATRVRFIKSLTFWNEDLNKRVSKKYLDWLWAEAQKNRHGASYKDYLNINGL